MARLRIGTAGWAIPRDAAGSFPAEGTTIARYAGRFDAVEINSSFHRPHRPATYARWAASVPEGFRFAVKLPKAITHQARLLDCEGGLRNFGEEIAGLGDRRGPVLVQLPPSLAFDTAIATAFFTAAIAILDGPIVCEPRHASWFADDADALLRHLGIARVAADPAASPSAGQPGGWPGLAYFRLHGSPRTYWSRYDEAALAAWAARIAIPCRDGVETWVIFDNTAGGAAAGNALEFKRFDID